MMFKGLFGETISEFLGTMVLILFGDGCVATFALFNNLGANNGATPFANTWTVIIFGWGFAVMLGIYVAGKVSGAHINPAVTLALAVNGAFPWRKVIPYWVAQVLGAFVAALILYYVYNGAIFHQLALNGATNIADPAKGVGGVFYTSNKGFVGTFGAFADEFVGTALLVGLILAIVDGKNQPVQAGLNPFIIGILIVAIGASFGLNTGYAINPARDFGPRLWIALAGGGGDAFDSATISSYWWIPIVAPLLGGAAGGLIYKYTMARVIEEKDKEAAAVEAPVSAATGD